MTTIRVETKLSKAEAIHRAVEKIEKNEFNKPFLFTGAIYNRGTGQVTFVEIDWHLKGDIDHGR